MSDLNDRLIQAARDGDASLCRDLLVQGADANAKGEDDWTPLHHASNYGYTEICQILFTFKADPNARSVTRHTSLHLSANKDQPETFMMLLEHGADINLKNLNGVTALDRAISNGFWSIPAAIRARDAKQAAMNVISEINRISP